jgi:hypothetical protein
MQGTLLSSITRLQPLTPQFHVSFDDTFSSVAPTNPETIEDAINRLLDRTSWLYKDHFDNPAAYHFFPTPHLHDIVAAILSLLANTRGNGTIENPSPRSPTYKPVRSSAALEQWKQDNGIAAEVFAASPPSTTASAFPHRSAAHTRSDTQRGPDTSRAPPWPFAKEQIPGISEGAPPGTSDARGSTTKSPPASGKPSYAPTSLPILSNVQGLLHDPHYPHALHIHL